MATYDHDGTRWKIILAYLAVAALGVPIWWCTTALYRAPIPFDQIARWNESHRPDTSMVMEFKVHVATGFWRHANVETLKASTQTSLEKSLRSAHETAAQFLGTDSIPYALKANIKTFEYVSDDLALVDTSDHNTLDDALAKKDSNEQEYDVYLLPSRKNTDDVFISTSRRMIIRLPENYKNEQIHEALHEILSKILTADVFNIAKGLSSSLDASIEQLRAVKPAPQYHLSFNLLNGDPFHIQVNWDIEKTINDYVKPFLDEVDHLFNIKIASQIQNFASLAIRPVFDEAKNRHYIYPDMLPHFIHSTEWNLAAAGAKGPEINMILYVPETSLQPLYITNEQKQIIETNAFLIPRSGGVVVHNVPNDVLQRAMNGTEKLQLSTKDLKPAMLIFLSQIRDLLGVEPVWPAYLNQDLKGKSIYTHPSYSGISDWEKDKLARRLAVANIYDAAETLTSLSRMLEKIQNIAVGDHIHHAILKALSFLDQARHAITLSSVELSLLYAREASKLAENVFFDSKMLGMLYFPDEHLYAVYAPLFVPVAVPLLAGIVRELKRRRQLRRNKQKIE